VVFDRDTCLDQASLAATGGQTAGLERRQAAFFQEDETLEVVTGSLQLQDKRGAHDSQTTHQLASHLGQSAKHMLDAGARRGDSAVTPFLCLGNALRCMASSLDVHAPSSLLQSGFPFDAGVAPVGIHVAAGVARVEQLFEDIRVGHGSMRDADSTDQLAALVDTGMQLVAKVILAVLFGPPGIDIFLRALVRLPTQRHRAFLDRLGLLALVALDRGLHQRSVDDLAATRQVTLRQ